MIKCLNPESFFFNITINDVAEPWGLFFQDNVTPQMEGLEELHNNIMFYLAIILLSVLLILVLFLLVIIMIYRFIRYLLTTPFNLTITPKAHAFIEAECKSSMFYGAVAICIITMISQKSNYLFMIAGTLYMLFETTGIPTSYLISITELLIKDITDIYISTFNQFNGPGLGFEMLRTIHINLTTYLTNYHCVFTLLQKIVGFFGGSPELSQMQDLATRFFDSGRNLLSIYRQIEIVLRISLAASPISTQVWGF